MKIEKKAAVLAVLVAFVLSLTIAVLPVSACKYGCTPGFWRQPQHFGYWTAPYVPDGDTPTLVGDVFANAALYGLENDTLLEALNYQGGPGLEGAARIYLRAAVALLLSSAYNDALGGDPWGLGWDFTPPWIVDKVNTNLSSENRAIMIKWAEQYDLYNNTELGCPLEGQAW
jgi:hypothetical protein